jgi:Ser/Thr protein kinase RdoA (MazF antagonist)
VVHRDAAETVLQKLNGQIFLRPERVMENMARVCEHLVGKVPEPARQTLRVIATRSGQPYHLDGEGNAWRLLHLVREVQSFDQIDSPARACEVGRAFGEFQAHLADLPQPRLHETIPNFHHTPIRYRRLLEVVAADPVGRSREAGPELALAGGFADQVARLVDAQRLGLIPERVTHNDTKLNNLLFDEHGQAVCVVDLDTVMPGLIHYDFGDMVRTATCLAREDETDLALVRLDRDIFAALVDGYLRGVQHFVSEAEVELLAFSGLLITYEVAIRFLTDHLEGDVYFKVDEPGHNLRRARNQFCLFQDLQRNQEWMHCVVQECWRNLKKA